MSATSIDIRTLSVINPATGEEFATVPAASADEVQEAIARARDSAVPWGATPHAERRAAIHAMSSAIRDNIDELALLLTSEQGKPLARARGEIESGLRYVEAAADIELVPEVIRDDEQERIELHRVPLGIVAAITAWNYPLMLALWKIGPALAAGNAVLVKPSPYTPVATVRMGEILADVLPRGLVQVVAGGDATGRALTESPAVNKISFTGSQATGRAIMAASAPTLKRLTLELGGNDAGIVLDDADPAAIAADLYWGGLSNCGQVCAGLKRLYVPADRLDDYVDALSAVAATVRVGPGTDPDVDMGPIQNFAQAERVRRLVSDSELQGARVVFLGEAPSGPGYWHPVTLMTCADDAAPIVAEEQFGPVLPILTYSSVDEAVKRANGTTFGLGASVWSGDTERAEQVADRLVAGTVWVNQHPMLSPDTPFGGVKQSGIGVESSVHGLLSFTDFNVRRTRR